MRSQSQTARFALSLLLSLAALLAAMLTVLLPVMILPQAARAQEGPLDKSLPKGVTVDEIIKRFAAKEKEFRIARDQYTFRQERQSHDA